MLRPWISTNLAISADGKITSVEKRSSGWTSKADHQRLLDLRRGAGALMVGHGTLKADRMTLTVDGQENPPLRCIVTRDGGVESDHPVFSQAGGPIHILSTRSNTPAPVRGAVMHHGNLESFLRTLHTEQRVERLHCEGGGMLIRELARLDAIDEFHLTLAGHTLFGGRLAPSPTGLPEDWLPASREFELRSFEPHLELGECFLSYIRRRNAQ